MKIFWFINELAYCLPAKITIVNVLLTLTNEACTV